MVGTGLFALLLLALNLFDEVDRKLDTEIIKQKRVLPNLSVKSSTFTKTTTTWQDVRDKIRVLEVKKKRILKLKKDVSTHFIYLKEKSTSDKLFVDKLLDTKQFAKTLKSDSVKLKILRSFTFEELNLWIKLLNGSHDVLDSESRYIPSARAVLDKFEYITNFGDFMSFRQHFIGDINDWNPDEQSYLHFVYDQALIWIEKTKLNYNNIIGLVNEVIEMNVQFIKAIEAEDDSEGLLHEESVRLYEINIRLEEKVIELKEIIDGLDLLKMEIRDYYSP